MPRKRFAKSTDMDIDCALLDIDVATPDTIQDLRTRIDTLGMLDEEIE